MGVRSFGAVGENPKGHHPTCGPMATQLSRASLIFSEIIPRLSSAVSYAVVLLSGWRWRESFPQIHQRLVDHGLAQRLHIGPPGAEHSLGHANKYQIVRGID